jgi:hypothetical protein
MVMSRKYNKFKKKIFMKNNKEELKKQAEKLQKDLDALKALINKEENIDLFSINTYGEVCKALKEKSYSIKDFEYVCEEDREKLLAFTQLKQIERLFNQDWIRDWSNESQYKYYPYFTVNSSGGLVFFGSYYSLSSSDGEVGFFKDQKTSDYIGRTFINIYEKLK